MTIRILTAILILLFYIAYFAKQILLRRQGINTNRLARGSKPGRTRRIETLLLFATYGTAAVQLASVFLSGYLLPIPLPLPVRAIGALLAALGLLFFALAITTMRSSWRAGVDESQRTEMITSGVYRLSRNPAFVGFDLLYIGTFLALPNVVLLVAAVFTIVLLHLQILEEEKFLPKVFGAAYGEYRRKTPRYLLF